jgi:hypothetical protein
MAAIVSERVNIYTCDKCGNQTITVHADEGIAPVLIGCDKCKNGDSQSHFYNVPQNLKAKYEWFKPLTDAEIKEQIKWEAKTFHNSIPDEPIEFCFENTKEYIRLGVLLLRPINGQSSES